MRRRAAVIGAGVSGLTAAYLLQRAYDVTVYEADDRLGGHAHTHDLLDTHGRTVGVDSGFIVHNRRTYPHLIRLFDELGVATQDSEMSMSVRCDGCGLEYAGARGLPGLFPSAGHVARPAYLRMLADVPRFHRAARAHLAHDGADETLTLGAFLDRHRFGAYTRQHFVVPLVSAVWSCDAETAAAYPARYLFQFLAHHGMLSVTGSPTWRTVVGGSARYVERLAKGLTATHTGLPVRAVARVHDGVVVHDGDGDSRHFDAAVVATHADDALRLLADPTPAQMAALGPWRYSRNATVLHTDDRVMPRHPRAAASWNYRMPSCDARSSAVRVSYDMNRLQRLATDRRWFVTLNHDGDVPADRVLARMDYAHPVFTPESVRTQELLPALNDGVLAFAGAYHGWGFHEDGCRSGVEAAASLGVEW
ncbi:NAD(P)/FAD-dependent oxidoreductase [Mumia quercus]|uniref:NAD(P)/FAD-dependent oxidoreductase n=1 Tax=Mumia quercus TaxID=2976125 RepID=UPI0021D1DA0E|nr:FAD-dependent oxidoreductase [Mumia quercus]